MRQKKYVTGHVKPGLARPIPWYTKEKRIVLLGARGLWDGRFESEGEALRACRAALARAGLEGRHTVEAIRGRIRTELRRLRKPPSRAYYTATERRVIDRFARAVVRHEYVDAAAATRDCRKALARRKHSFPRTDVAIAARIWERALECGRKHIRARWAPEERQLIRELAREVSSGRFREVRDASRAFQVVMARKRRAGAGGSKVPVRQLDCIDQQLTREARRAGLIWGFRDWSPEEDRVVDSFIGRYSKGEFRSFRSAARACRAELRRLDAERLKHPERGRPYGRTFLAVRQRLNKRAHERGIHMPRFRLWRGPEQRIAARYAERIAARGRKPDTWEAATLLRRALRRRGYQRTLAACKAELRRARLRMIGVL
jgi:hypothetical protein